VGNEVALPGNSLQPWMRKEMALRVVNHLALNLIYVRKCTGARRPLQRDTLFHFHTA